MVPRGAGTKIDWGAPPERVDIMLDTGRLAGIGHQAPDRGTLRVQAVPAARVWVTRPVWTPLEVHDLIQAVLAARLDPAAIELDLPVGAGTGSLLEGGPAEVAERTDRLVGLLGSRATVARTAPPWWRSYPFAPGDTALRLEVPMIDLHAAVYALRDAAGGPVPVRGSARRSWPRCVACCSPDRVGAWCSPPRRPSAAPSTCGASAPTWPSYAPSSSTWTPPTASPPAASPAASRPNHRSGSASLRRTRMAMSSRGSSTEKLIAVARNRAATTSAE